MNDNIRKRLLLFISIIIFLLEVLLIYILIRSFLTKDIISPNKVMFYEYIKVKLSNLI